MKSTNNHILVSRRIGLILALSGIAGMLFFVNKWNNTAWLLYLALNYFMLSVLMGVGIFHCIQVTTDAKWSRSFLYLTARAFRFVYIPILFLVVYVIRFTFLYDHGLYHSHAYYSKWFMFSRAIIFFASWIMASSVISKWQLNAVFSKPKTFNSHSFLIILLAISYMLFTLDFIHTLNPSWLSTIFPLKNLVSSFLTGSLFIFMVLLSTPTHLNANKKLITNTISRYVFVLVILYAYFWYVQYMLIWYGNLPSETYYFQVRTSGSWSNFFYAELIIGIAVPFALLIFKRTDLPFRFLQSILVLTLAGRFVDILNQVLHPIEMYLPELYLMGFMLLFFIGNYMILVLILPSPEFTKRKD